MLDVIFFLKEGIIEELNYDGKDLNIKIECSFLAAQVNPSFKYFYLVFKSVEDYSFVPWEDEYAIINSDREIKLLQPEILNAEIEEEHLKIYVNCANVYSGGNIFIHCDSVKIFDENLELLGIEDLFELTGKYQSSLLDEER